MIDKDSLSELLQERGIEVANIHRYKNIAYRFKLVSGSCVYIYDKGGFFCQGNEADTVRQAIEPELVDKPNDKVFVACGRDGTSRNQLDRLLKSLGAQPIFLDEQPVEGKTIIEQLEKYIPQANFGIVLMTPDDVGGLNGDTDSLAPRARQNVVLELGMLLMKLGRSRTAIVLKSTAPTIEIPSDIEGIHRLQFKEDVFEIKDAISKELKNKGYSISE